MSDPIKISESMTPYPEVVTKEVTVDSALSLMKKYNIRHLPVVDGNKLVGVVSERDLRRPVGQRQIPISEIMMTDIYKVKGGSYLYQVAEAMAEKKYGCAVVENDKKEVVGIFTSTDALYLLSRLLRGKDNINLKLNQINWARFPDYMI